MLEESIVGALVLISGVNNTATWSDVLGEGLGGVFTGKEALIIVLNAFNVPINQKMILNLEEDSLFRKALEWMKCDLRKALLSSAN